MSVLRRSVLAAAGLVAGCAAVTGLDAYELVDPVGDAGTDAGAPLVDAASMGGPDVVAPPPADVFVPDAPAAPDAAPLTSRRVFISKSTVSANLGGLSGGDAKCQSFADVAGLGGRWLAWLGDRDVSPRSRFVQSTVPYKLVDGTLVAKD